MFVAQKTVSAKNDSDFRKIYESAMQILFKVSYRIVGDEEAAEDLVHDALIKMHEKGLEFPSYDDAKYWLIRVVKTRRSITQREKGAKDGHTNRCSGKRGGRWIRERPAC